MRSFLCVSFIFAFLVIHTVFPQDVVVTLAGSTINQGFSVKNSVGDTLFRVRGNGSVGIGTALPIGFLDMIAGTLTTGDAKDINIFGQNTQQNTGLAGSINIKSGWAPNFGGSINIETQHFPDFPTAPDAPGEINIKTATGDITGGINIFTGSGYGISGNINIETGFTEAYSGNIELGTGNCNGEKSGDILLNAGNNTSHSSTSYIAGNVLIKSGDGFLPNGGNIELTSGNSSDSNGGDIKLTTGNSTAMGDGGDIIITPGLGSVLGMDGMVIINGSGTYSGTWTLSSDVRFKKNVEPIENAINKIEQLNGISYELKKEEFPEKNFSDGKQVGLIAQEVEKVLPELVVTDSEGYKSVAYQNLVAVLVEAIKEQQSSIDKLKTEIEKLKSLSETQDIEVSSLGN